jgi:mannose-6-phosphate isomerase-like protein (cupin superfamily)
MLRKSFGAPDEVRPFPHGKLELVDLGGKSVGRGTFEPGWRWSQDVKPIAKTEHCEAAHAGYVISGRMHIVMKDGSEADFGPGDAMAVPPGHDAWIVGNEPCVVIDWTGFTEYAKPQ